ncbi:hypothetical protein [Pseudorhodoplanes sinuspersici]|uniref:Uncharacterized protein n=1 Tax=Pseudorhodoplanes sinuspersici TaxID=1235591 RepID=A0A1W6ZP99_9HYPH|nr:hypothetical protein [Pseudorhodoplanes sinuspersici]ARP98604.1 hypothetical protein CAK95_05545 [Pseudorhodoplanes sinuspersici]RKE69816.1 hypothetical protein DFP91_4258 [Pseudorhodoplanes sinuspersici]
MFRTLVIAPFLLLAAPAAAQNAPDTDNGRYTLNRTDDGYLRLDQQTGHVSVCTRRELGWACHPVPDERSALEEEIARLQKANAALKKDMLARGVTPPGTPQAKAQTPPQDGKSPTDAEIDRAIATAERIWRRLVEMIARLQRDIFTQI